MRSRWWSRIPLVGRLTAALVGLLSVGLIAGTISMVLFLQGRLTDQIDDQLYSTARTIGRAALQQIVEGDTRSGILPLEHYILLQDATLGEHEWIDPSTRDRLGQPDLSRYDFDVALTDGTTGATTVPNLSGGNPWRAITIATQGDGRGRPTTGIMTIALPLHTVDSTLSEFLQRVLFVDLAVIALGGIIGSMLVARSMRPLRHIEVVAGRIAAGDLTQRVPQTLPTSTEVGSLARSLNMMLTQIERSFAHRRASEQRMRRFVSDASHELRTPLATVRGYGELYRLGGIPPEELTRTMGRIEGEAKRMSLLVEDLLTLARIDEERGLNITDVELVVLASDAATDLRALDRTRAVTVMGLTTEKVEAVTALADSDKIRQVLTNLTGNVVQHTPPGTPVEIAVGYLDGQAVVEVRDHGPGVPDEDLQKVFGRFYRTDTSRSRSSGGTGLGLAIVAAIVAAHDGTTRALATPGGGLTVRVTLPAAPTKRTGLRIGRGGRSERTSEGTGGDVE